MARPANPELREKILKAAADIIEECGPDCVTMREVAEKVGYSPTTIYLYFKDKNALLRESVLLSFDELNEACRLAAVGPNELDKYRQRMRAYVIWGLTNPGHYFLMFDAPWEMEWTVDLASDSLDRLTAARRDDLDVLGAAIEGGELPAGTDLEALEESTWAGVHGATALAISGRLTADDPSARPADVIARTTRITDDIVNALLAVRRTPPA